MKERKCTFGSGSCIYLGHVVENGLVQPMECKVEAVKTFKQPKTKKDVRSFLGLCGYYRKFIPNFSSIATPLSDLTRKSMPKQVKWNEKCDKAFIELKEILTLEPILVMPDWTKPFILQTDASAFGLGYVLSQIDGTGEEHPIAFASKFLLQSERNYSAIECVALAIVQGVKTLPYLSAGIKVYNRNRPQPINSARQPEGQSWQVGKVGPICRKGVWKRYN